MFRGEGKKKNHVEEDIEMALERINGVGGRKENRVQKTGLKKMKLIDSEEQVNLRKENEEKERRTTKKIKCGIVN